MKGRDNIDSTFAALRRGLETTALDPLPAVIPGRWLRDSEGAMAVHGFADYEDSFWEPHLIDSDVILCDSWLVVAGGDPWWVSIQHTHFSSGILICRFLLDNGDIRNYIMTRPCQTLAELNGKQLVVV